MARTEGNIFKISEKAEATSIVFLSKMHLFDAKHIKLNTQYKTLTSSASLSQGLSNLPTQVSVISIA